MGSQRGRPPFATPAAPFPTLITAATVRGRQMAASWLAPGPGGALAATLPRRCSFSVEGTAPSPHARRHGVRAVVGTGRLAAPFAAFPEWFGRDDLARPLSEGTPPPCLIGTAGPFQSASPAGEELVAQWSGTSAALASQLGRPVDVSSSTPSLLCNANAPGSRGPTGSVRARRPDGPWVRTARGRGSPHTFHGEHHSCTGRHWWSSSVGTVPLSKRTAGLRGYSTTLSKSPRTRWPPQAL